MTSGGFKRPVKGDLCKVSFVSGLSVAAKHLLKHAFEAMKVLAGTNGVRRKMRFISKSMQVFYGLPIFVTISPDEKHQAIMLRMVRVRRSDPAYIYDTNLQGFSGPNQPCFVGDGCSVPTYEDRKVVLAQSPVSVALGFRVQILLVMQAAFGLRVCLDCPRCARGRDGKCGDMLGNSSRLEGGAFGRCCAICWSVETQKQGSLHVHGHAVLENLHQHHALAEIADILLRKGRQVVEQYMHFKKHVCRQEYACMGRWTEEAQQKTEKNWPEFADEVDLYLVPAFIGSTAMSDVAWKQAYETLLFGVQSKRQHHIHLPNAEGIRKPLPSCLDSSRSGLCKHGFPLESQLCPMCCVVCPGMAELLDLPQAGRKNALGMLHGPRSDPNLNGSSGILLAMGRDNSDVQIPYRLPVCEVTHSQLCKKNCVQVAARQQGWAKEMERAAAMAQAAQVGCLTDYANKGQAAALHECKEFGKGHETLSTDHLKQASQAYASKRHVQRLVADCYARGRVRGAVETENLNLHTEMHSCAGEFWTSFPYTTFGGQDFLSLTEDCMEPDLQKLKYRLQAHQGRPKRGGDNISFAHQGVFYGFRGGSRWLHQLSAYEWVAGWEVICKPVPEDQCHRRIVEFSKEEGVPEELQFLGSIADN